MRKFEDHLWSEVVRQHGRDLELARRPVAKRRRPRPRLLAGTTLGLAGAGTALVLVLSATTSPPAFAVTSNPNGTVTVTINKLAGITGANRALAALEVRARVSVAVGCLARPPQNGRLNSTMQAQVQSLRTRVASMTIDPRKIPADRVLVLRAYSVGSLVQVAATVRGAAALRPVSAYRARHGASVANTGNSGISGNSGSTGQAPLLKPAECVPPDAGNTGNSGTTGNSGAG